MAVRASTARNHAARRARPADSRPSPPQPTPSVPLTDLVSLPAAGPAASRWQLDVRVVTPDGAVSLVDAQAQWGWGRATRLAIDVAGATVTLTAAGGPTASVMDQRGRVRLPLAWRRLHRLETGGRVVILTAVDDPTPTVRIQPAEHAAGRIVGHRPDPAQIAS